MGNRGDAVYSASDIKDRCVEVGDCWEWQGAMSNNRSPVAALPTQYPKRPTDRAIRVGAHVLMWEAHHKKSVGSLVVYRLCLNRLCCNPAHLRAGTKTQMSRYLATQGAYKRSPSAIAAITQAKRATAAKLTMEQAREIRESTEGVVELGRKYGVNKSLISRIKAGTAWREFVAVSSVFAWRPAA